MNLVFNVSRGANNNYYEIKDRFNDEDAEIKYASADDDEFALRFNVKNGAEADELQQNLASGLLAGAGGSFDIEGDE